jgi:integrase
VSRAIVKEYGSRGSRRCLVLKEAGGRYLVERYVAGLAKRKRFADKAHAIAWARTWYESGIATAKDFTLRQLLDLWMDTESEKKKWRSATRTNYRNHRKRIEEALGPDIRANALGHADLDHLWNKLTRPPFKMAGNQVAAKVRMLKRVYAWALAREFVSHNKVGSWDVPEVEKAEPGEYTPADAGKILAAWDKDDGWAWRPWALTMLAQSHGIRINALLNLKWSDVDLEAGVIRMRGEVDKTRESWERPLTWDGLSALLTARYHRGRLEKAGDYVFYGKGGKPYTYGAYWAALGKAERRAKVKHQKWRAAHGFRRTAVTTIRQETGDPTLALLWVNHKRLADAAAYIKGREDEFRDIAEGTR